jgi:two-component system chemotaxis response regulator CheY
MAKKVVFVDDSKTVLMTAQLAMKPLIESGQIEFYEYENPLSLLEAVENGFVYDLVITDVNMPQMNGLDMAKELKSKPNLKLKPILALTTENSAEKKSLAKEIGLAGWITKPFSPDKLLMGVKRVLRLR